MLFDEPHFENPVELLVEENMDDDVMETDEEKDEITETPRNYRRNKKRMLSEEEEMHLNLNGETEQLMEEFKKSF
ncbi:unnamed protein product [Parnassius apollo]|uniref:(apollo) hypothetical protein n=1 Tax=Parnassius apollo TaxID=110799 RepID=A0A8S3X9A2_PARAO|nr:unnamed protein product [Parnassius apollo]